MIELTFQKLADAIKKTDYKYLCDYEMTEEQRDAVELLVDAAVELMAMSASRTNRLISIEDRMPEIGQECLIEIPVCDKFNLESARYKGNGVWVGAWCDFRGKGCTYNVTRWMPSPISNSVTQ